MATVSIGIDPRQLDEIRDLLGPRKLARAMQAAVSRTITTGVALMARRIGEEVRLKIKDIKDSIKSSGVKLGSYDKPYGTITIRRDKAVWLTYFMSGTQATPRIKRSKDGGFVQRQRRGGVKVRVRRKPTPKYPTTEVHPHAWVGYAIAPKAGAFERFGPKVKMTKGKYVGKLRQKIRRKRGPSPLGVFINASGDGAATVFKEIEQKLAVALQKNMASQVDRFLNPRATDRIANA